MHPTYIKFRTPDSGYLKNLCEALFNVKTLEQTNEFKALIKQALNKGFDINMKDGDHCTLLYYSCTLKLYEIAQFLLENGADPNIRNTVYDQITPLSIIRAHPETKDSTDLTKLILQAAKNYNNNSTVEKLTEQLIDEIEIPELELTGKTAEVTAETI
ncbi:ankyrin repeat domain-containing protein [Rickettsia endosymbiont of Pantilius tunicatus]|uniref:ankyrin repeat domain-containing protein n=1 Tax=Rickettsia endosymbiont of Pantilius tunicatus TaxID=3066267 RepID=UPI0030E268A0